MASSVVNYRVFRAGKVLQLSDIDLTTATVQSVYSGILAATPALKGKSLLRLFAAEFGKDVENLTAISRAYDAAVAAATSVSSPDSKIPEVSTTEEDVLLSSLTALNLEKTVFIVMEGPPSAEAFAASKANADGAVDSDFEDDSVLEDAKFRGLSKTNLGRKLNAAFNTIATETLEETVVQTQERLEVLLSYADATCDLLVEYKPFIRSVSPIVLKTLLKRQSFAVTEEFSLWTALMTWLGKFSKTLALTPEVITAEYARLIRYPLFEVEQLTGAVMDSGYVPVADMLPLVMYVTLMSTGEYIAPSDPSETETETQTEEGEDVKKKQDDTVNPEGLKEIDGQTLAVAVKYGIKPRIAEEDQEDDMAPGGGKMISFKPKTTHPDGLMQFLGYLKNPKALHGKKLPSFVNPVSSKLVAVISSGCYSFPQSGLKGGHLFDKSQKDLTNASFATQSGQQNDVVFYFNQHLVRIRGFYMVVSYNGYDPKSWIVEGCSTEDGKKWFPLHKMEAADHKAITGQVHKVKKNQGKWCRQVRYRWAGLGGNPTQFVCNYMEFTGQIRCAKAKIQKTST